MFGLFWLLAISAVSLNSIFDATPAVFAATEQWEDVCCPDLEYAVTDIKWYVQDLRAIIVYLLRQLEIQFQWRQQTAFCPSGYTYLPEAKKCYKVVFESHDWTSAGRKCQDIARGSHLVAITNKEESTALSAFLTTELTKNPGQTACIPISWPGHGDLFWTSGYRQIENNCKSPFLWKLPNDKTLAFTFTNWQKGEPNCYGSSENCMHLLARENFEWNDAPCNWKMCPVCETTPIVQ